MPVTPAAEHAATIGVGPELLAAATSARHDLDPGVRAWFSSRPIGPGGLATFAFGAELAASHRVDERAELYRFGSWDLSAAFLGDWAIGTHATTVRLGLGPAAVLRTTTFASDALDGGGARISPGLRVRGALDGPLGGWTHVAWTVRTGITAGLEGTDWDVGVGGGYRW